MTEETFRRLVREAGFSEECLEGLWEGRPDDWAEKSEASLVAVCKMFMKWKPEWCTRGQLNDYKEKA